GEVHATVDDVEPGPMRARAARVDLPLAVVRVPDEGREMVLVVHDPDPGSALAGEVPDEQMRQVARLRVVPDASAADGGPRGTRGRLERVDAASEVHDLPGEVVGGGHPIGSSCRVTFSGPPSLLTVTVCPTIRITRSRPGSPFGPAGNRSSSSITTRASSPTIHEPNRTDRSSGSTRTSHGPSNAAFAARSSSARACPWRVPTRVTSL